MTQSFQKMGLLIYVALFAAFIFFNKVVDLLADYFWFQEVGLSSVFEISLFSNWGLGISCAILAWLSIFVNLYAARTRAKKEVLVLNEEEIPMMPDFHDLRRAAQPFLLLASVVVAYFIGVWAGAHWESIQQFKHATAFGSADPIFGRDIGFYVFTLPAYAFAGKFLAATLIFSALWPMAVYIVEGKLLLTSKGPRATPAARNHLFFLGGCVCLAAFVHFQIKAFDLMNMQRSVAPGPGYAVVHSYFPALNMLKGLAVICALLLWAAPLLQRSLPAVVGIALLAGGSLLAVGYREFVQKFEVGPNEIVKETPFILRGVEHTRKAFGIDKIEELEFDPRDNLSAEALRKNFLTVNNIRLWDHAPLLTTFGQLQEIRTYYDFIDVDNDRYMIDGLYRQVMLSPRELNPAALPSRIWINEHLTYTHGYGLTMGPVNRISPEGLPEFFIKDIPPQSTNGFKVTRPEIYYGEAKGSYVIVNTKSKEFDYPSGDENIYTTYQGSGGVPIRGFWRKLLFALRFKELKILLTGDITSESKILYHRNIQERLARAAPFLRYDQDPYLVVSEEGRLHWIVDAYTVTDRYPYSEKVRGVGNYIRNSVKVAIDAYHGSLTFYVTDDADPIIQTYGKIFPGVFKPISEMPQDLKRHLRYPQDLFAVQARIYATYHMTDPQVFYNKEDLWKIPEKDLGTHVQRMAPYYTIMKLAGVGAQEEFILMVPFTPARKENMISWMAARCDAPNYGKLLVYNFPKQKLVYGPQQIESRIDQEAEISKQLTLWNQGGSKVIRGSLLVIPIESSLIYVQPLYLEATGGGLPELKRVIVAHGNAIAMEENLEASLNRLFIGGIERPDPGSPPAMDGQEPNSTGMSRIRPPPAGGSSLKDLAREARERFDKAQSHLKRGDLSAYGAEIKEVERLIRKMSESP